MSIKICIKVLIRKHSHYVIKEGFHRVEFCDTAENALKRFLRMLTKQKLSLYERFSELCRIAAFCDQPIKWLDELTAKKHNGNCFAIFTL